MNMTKPIRESLEWMIRSEVFRQGVDPQLMDDPVRLAQSHSWSPEMLTAIALLAPLRSGYIVCDYVGPSGL